MKFSIPVVLLDETLKFVARKFTDGESYIYTLHWIVLMWGAFFALILFSPL
jgi:Ca2+ transporting ATPase